MIKDLGIKLTKKQYNQLAVRFNLLSADSLQYISRNNFDFLIKKTISSIQMGLLFLNKNRKIANIKNMKNYYKKSKKIFKETIKNNKNITREEWDEYAHENCLFSAFTLACHVDAYSFEELKRKMKRSLFQFHKRKWHFSTIVDKKYVIRKIVHTKDKGGKYENRDIIKRYQKEKTDTVQNNYQN